MIPSEYGKVRMSSQCLTERLRKTGHLDPDESIYEWWFDDEGYLRLNIGRQPDDLASHPHYDHGGDS